MFCQQKFDSQSVLGIKVNCFSGRFKKHYLVLITYLATFMSGTVCLVCFIHIADAEICFCFTPQSLLVYSKGQSHPVVTQSKEMQQACSISFSDGFF